MKVLWSWLNEFVENPFTPPELSNRLSLSGLEVESLRYLGEGLEPVFVGLVAAVNPHPNADRLRVCTVELGDRPRVEIVTAAENVQQGDIVPVALSGARLTTGLIEARTMRGVLSNGMLCSLYELGLEARQGAGIYVLPETLAVGGKARPAAELIGYPAVTVLGLDDWLLEVAPTPNRPDCLSMLGVAREVAALARVDAGRPPAIAAPPGGRDDLPVPPVQLDDRNCLAYYLGLVTGLAVGPTPEWMRRRLQLCGFRSINNVVDVTNYVMHELGQPLHAFDRERVSHGIVVRPARQGERMTTLDGSDLELDESMMLIADERASQALAGVMGGLSSEVSEATYAILLESAYFVPRSIRRTSLKVNIHSESAIRFRQGVDRAMVQTALTRALQLLHRVAAGDDFAWGTGAALDPQFTAQAPAAITLRRHRLAKILGYSPAWEEIPGTLGRLGCRVEELQEDRLAAVPPSWRADDLLREIDLIEEVARLEGYDRIPTTLPGKSFPGRQGARLELAARCRRLLGGMGLTEAVTSSLVGGEALRVGTLLLPAQPLKNPITSDLDHLRPNLYIGHLAVLRENLQLGQEDVHLYEVGQVFDPAAGGPDAQGWRLAGLLYGSPWRGLWREPPPPLQSDFFAVKGLVVALAEFLGLYGWHIEPLHGTPPYHPGRTARICFGDSTLGTFGELHPGLGEAMAARKRVCLFDLDFDRLHVLVQESPALLHRPPSRYPPVYRDISLVVRGDYSAAELEGVIRTAGGSYLESVVCFDCYMDPQRAPGERSLSFHLVFRAADRTLEERDVEAAQEAILSHLRNRLGIELRS